MQDLKVFACTEIRGIHSFLKKVVDIYQKS